MWSPPTEAMIRKFRRAGEPVMAIEGGGSVLVAKRQNNARLGIGKVRSLELGFTKLMGDFEKDFRTLSKAHWYSQINL